MENPNPAPSGWGFVLDEDEVSLPVRRSRFPGEERHREAIEADPELSEGLERLRTIGGGLDARRHMLSQAVRIKPSLLPSLAQALRDVQERAELDEPLEAYIYSSPEVQAAVLPVRDRKLILLSSATVERLTPPELDFVIGHELGHALLGHLDFPTQALLKRKQLRPRQAMRLLAHQRACEISADRVGLLCCGGLEVAANALFKTVSGLSLQGLRVDPHEFAGQWDELADEVRRGGADDFWQATHPFPPLRMKAIDLFWRSSLVQEAMTGGSGKDLDRINDRIESYLAMMCPLSREESTSECCADPTLVPFLLWGGLYVAAANRKVEKSELESLRTLIGKDTLQRALDSTTPSKRLYRQRFMQAMQERKQSLSALEIHRIFTSLATVAWADGSVDDEEIRALHSLADAFKLGRGFVDMITQNKGRAA